jgi:uncharacterized protein (DUF697 family)
MATIRTTRSRRRSAQVTAVATPDAQFLALLRRQCTRAAMIGALTAAGEAIPGLSRVLGLVFGELLDARILAELQRELVEKTLAIYGVELPAPVQEPLVRRVQMVGAGVSVASDTMIRQLVRRSVGAVGSYVAFRVLPVTSIASSAFSNAMVTYAVGKRAQSVAKLRDAPLGALPDALRAFSGIDERRVLDWTIDATKSSLGLVGAGLRKLVARKAKAPARKAPAKKKAARRRAN